MAERSYEIEIVNLTGEAMTLKDKHLNHGEWGEGESQTPPDRIDTAKKAHFSSESSGFMTGTEGYVVYTSKAGNFRVDWDNPYEGKDSSSAKCPPEYEKSISDSSGDNATLKVVFYPAISS